MESGACAASAGLAFVNLLANTSALVSLPRPQKLLEQKNFRERQ